MRKARFLAVILAMLGMTGCDMVKGFLSGGPEVTATAEAKLKSGDLPGAASEYSSLAADKPDNVYVSIGNAGVAMMKGDFAGADKMLAAVEVVLMIHE